MLILLGCPGVGVGHGNYWKLLMHNPLSYDPLTAFILFAPREAWGIYHSFPPHSVVCNQLPLTPRPSDVLQLLSHCTSSWLFRPSLFSFTFSVPFCGLPLFLQGMSDSFPLPSFYRCCHILLSCSCLLLLIWDDVQQEDAKYFAEYSIHKRLQLGEQRFC